MTINKGMVLVTGATGYIGGRLVPRLLQAGWPVRCLVRDAARLQGAPWRAQVEVVEGDVLRPAALAPALAGVEAAYYLVHSMAGGPGYAERDLAAARAFGAAAHAAGVRRVVYLGGLGDEAERLSRHLQSRQDTGVALRKGGVPVTELRAGVIVGSGSLSFEMIRHLTERVPVMICPKWVYTRTQPIAVADVLAYLLAALERAEPLDGVVEVGGSDVVTYGDMMRIYAEERGLKRRLLPVPVLTPRLSSYWVHLVTPIPAVIAQPLIQGLGSESVVKRPSAQQHFPAIQPVSYRVAVRRALQKLAACEVETSWSGALSSSLGDQRPVELTAREGMIRERRSLHVDAPAERVYEVFSALGGERGWLCWNWAWRIRGAVDRLLGGVGLRRGRRHPTQVRVGDALDFWRVEAVEEGRLMRLRAEMKVPGAAWLQLEAQPADGGCWFTQTAYFAPKGLAGLAYWYGLYPVHTVIFSGMARAIARAA